MIRLILPDNSSWNIPDSNTRYVYQRIAEYLNTDYIRNPNALTQEQHIIASDAEGWCELACVSECYEDSRIPGLKIQIINS